MWEDGEGEEGGGTLSFRVGVRGGRRGGGGGGRRWRFSRELVVSLCEPFQPLFHVPSRSHTHSEKTQHACERLEMSAKRGKREERGEERRGGAKGMGPPT